MLELKQIEEIAAARKRGDALVHFLLNGTSLENLFDIIVFEIMLYVIVDIANFPNNFLLSKEEEMYLFHHNS